MLHKTDPLLSELRNGGSTNTFNEHLAIYKIT